jgi:hypothetical protein
MAGAVRVTVFDRSASCACRPGEQRALMVLKGTLHGIRKEFGDQVEIAYHAYDQQPAAFEVYEDVVRPIEGEGMQVLPITQVDGAIEKTGVLPGLQEQRSFIVRGLG